jgi:hypothetical protein
VAASALSAWAPTGENIVKLDVPAQQVTVVDSCAVFLLALIGWPIFVQSLVGTALSLAFRCDSLVYLAL